MPTVTQLFVQFCNLSDCTVYSRIKLKNLFYGGKYTELAVSATIYKRFLKTRMYNFDCTISSKQSYKKKDREYFMPVYFNTLKNFR